MTPFNLGKKILSGAPICKKNLLTYLRYRHFLSHRNQKEIHQNFNEIVLHLSSSIFMKIPFSKLISEKSIVWRSTR